MATAATTTAAAVATETTKKHRFPRRLGRFINLEAGSTERSTWLPSPTSILEMQTGEDFIRFDRHQARNLRDTIDKFLAFDHHEHPEEHGAHTPQSWWACAVASRREFLAIFRTRNPEESKIEEVDRRGEIVGDRVDRCAIPWPDGHPPR
jgi:hypothetical protein